MYFQKKDMNEKMDSWIYQGIKGYMVSLLVEKYGLTVKRES
ncbi:hypothetical protein MITSMUL_03188 [Mitsuokella multacida DSM 20544]|uniref:Uncharacterized protein n=1 Tax=Mitsuokella multacida DSM 20544 TaxID=500635 RepID=C9KJI9_9FIRM|nr:hypothetical protein MITSMUL_03188 [Mitsuokella multacida DSM 20544]